MTSDLRALLVVLLLAFGAGCERDVDLHGDVFVRLGAGDTRPQGGVEVKLLSPDIKTDRTAIARQLDVKKQQFDALKSDMHQKQSEVDAAVKELNKSLGAGVEIQLLYARADAARTKLALGARVVNHTSFDVADVTFLLSCDDRPIYAAATPRLRLSTQSEEFLSPEQSRLIYPEGANPHVEARWRGAENFGSYAVNWTSAAECPLSHMRATVSSMSTRIRGTIRAADLDVSDMTVRGLRRELAALNKNAESIDVYDMDSSFGEAIQRRTVATVRTDVRGQYEFSHLRPGPYVLYSEYKSVTDDAVWLVDVDVRNRGTAQDLSNFNLSDRPSFGPAWKALQKTPSPAR